MPVNGDATFLFLSGTGNSFRAANWMADEASKAGLSVTVHPIDHTRMEEKAVSGNDRFMGLFLPTHGFTAPWLMLRFVLRLPGGKGARAFVVPTRAGTRIGPLRIPGMEGTAGWLIALILMFKGYRLRGVMGLDMPSNWLAIHWGLGRRSVEMITAHAEPKARRFMGDILSGKTRYGGIIPLLLGLALLPVSAAYLLMGRFFLSKLFFADNRCNGCGICARNCPASAIRMWPKRRPRPYWTFSCESCMRCMSFCPEQAVQAGQSWGVLLFYIVSTFGVFQVLNRLSPGVFGSDAINGFWPGKVIEYPFTLASLALAYFLFTFLVRIPVVNAFFAWTTLTRFWRRYHEPSVRLENLKGGENRAKDTYGGMIAHSKKNREKNL